MGVRSGGTRVVDLTFQVFDRVLHPEWFAVRRHRRVARSGWEADLRIVDGGHVISWGRDSQRLTEVLAGPDAALPRPGRLFEAPVRTERSATLRCGAVAEYQTCFDVERLEPEVFRHLGDELSLDAGKGLFDSVTPPNRLEPARLSFIRIDARPRGLSVQAFHTFPDEHAIVRTQSLFELLEPAAAC